MKNLKLKGLKYDHGKFELYDDRFIFFPPQIVNILSEIYGEGVKSLLVWLGKKAGWNLIQKWEENLNPKTLEDLVNIFCEIMNNQGWGRFDPMEINKDKIIIHHTHNISNQLKTKKKYFCYYITGILTGFGEFALYRVKINETNCCVDNAELEKCTYEIIKIE